MSFTDGKPRIATEQECAAKWGSRKAGDGFRCGICGHQFVVGDQWRWVYDNDGKGSCYGNFMTCRACDTPGVREKRKALVREWETSISQKFWWAIPGDES